MDDFFSSPRIFQDLVTKEIYCCGTVRPNRKDMPKDLGPKKIKTRRGDVHVRTRDNMTAILWRDKCDIYKLIYVHNAPAESNFCYSDGKTIKAEIVTDFSRYMGCVDKGDRMANSHSICYRTLKWTQKLFFHLFDLAILNSYILLSSCGGKENLTQRFSIHPCERYIGTSWMSVEHTKATSVTTQRYRTGQ
jgi:hypothetical protein